MPTTKPKLRTSREAYNAILFDPRHDPSLYHLGITTRFDGPQEMSLLDFAAHGEIPFHRVVYIRDQHQIRWDRRNRTDNLTGNLTGTPSRPDAPLPLEPIFETPAQAKEGKPMKAKELQQLGLVSGSAAWGVAMRLMPKAGKRLGAALGDELRAVIANPEAHQDHEYLGELAQKILEGANEPAYKPRTDRAPYQIWGEGLESGAITQMHNASHLPIAVRGALMPDAHQGYGLPIGGVLATRNAVIPYGVGVDIACRMKISVLDVPHDSLRNKSNWLEEALLKETRFGKGQGFERPNQHEVLDQDWNISRVTRDVFERARSQLGTSGSGNHFVEFGILRLPHPDLGLPAGEYLALLSHSGSRGAGATIAGHYSKLASEQLKHLPDELRRLAWLGMDTQEGQEYWAAMNLMGDYASANHAVIHKRVTQHLGANVLATVENHHNFAWQETHDGEDLIVHRKGATPAGRGVLGVIPGSMAAPGYVVRGLGNAASLTSASHGAGRAMSRTKAKEKFTWKQVQPELEAMGVKVLSAGIDENPFAYKDIRAVMAAQEDLVQIVAEFRPKIVRMAEDGEQPED